MPPLCLRGWLHPSPGSSGSGEVLEPSPSPSGCFCPAPRSLPPGGLGTAGLPTGGSFDRPSPTHRRVAGGEMFAGLGEAKQPLKPSEQPKCPHPAPPDPLLLASLARRLRLMLREWHGCFCSIKAFPRGKRRSLVGRKARRSKREFYPAHGYGMGPRIVIFPKVKRVPKVKTGAPAEGGKRSISGAAQPPRSTRVGRIRECPAFTRAEPRGGATPGTCAAQD